MTEQHSSRVYRIKEKLEVDPINRVRFEKLKRDPYMYINEVVSIEDKDVVGSVIDFDLWEAQEKALSKMINNRLSVVLKARQLGLSWLALSYGTHIVAFNPGKSVSVISQTEEDAKELIRRVDFILRHLPNWLIVSKDTEEEDWEENTTGIWFEKRALSIQIHFPDEEDSFFKGYTSSPGSARSFTDNLVIMDEWAFHPMAEDIWTSAYPTINRPTGGKVIGISTGERGTFFEEIWNDAEWEFELTGESGRGRNGFVGIFLPWDSDPRRDREWYERTRRALPRTYRKEYPSSPEEAFSIGKGAMFPEWNKEIHVIHDKAWYPPDSWRIVGAYDGAYKQPAFVWVAISNDGWAVAYREYYDSFVTDPEQAEAIRALSRDKDGRPEQIDYIVADTSCWAKSQDSGKSTVKIFRNHGIRPIKKADKDRIMGWRRLHEWLKPLKDEDGNYIPDRFGDPLAKLRVTPNCPNIIRTIPGLQYNEHKPEDLDNGQEDHLVDALRYLVMTFSNNDRIHVPKMEKRRREKKRKKMIEPISKEVGY